MSKIRTRKGLALGASLGLLAGGFSAAPAFAVDSIVTSLSSGSSFNSVAGYGTPLELGTVMSPGLSGNEATLHYRISNPLGASLQILVGNSSSAVAQVTTGQSSNTGGVWEYGKAAYSSVDSDGVQSGMQTALTDFVVVPLGTKDGEADDINLIKISVIDAAGATDVDITVTSWLDTASNATNIQDTVEVAGNTVALKFFDAANITATSVMNAPVTGAATASAIVTTTPELNGDQLGADFIDVSWTSQGNGNAVLAENTVGANGSTAGTTTYSDVTNSWTSTAQLSFSVATDAWNGANGTKAAIPDLLDTDGSSTKATVAVTVASKLVTMAVFPHGLGASNTGAFVGSFTDLDSTNNVATNSDFPLKPLTIVNADSATFQPVGSTELGFATVGDPEVVTGGAVSFFSVGGNSGVVVAGGTYSATPYIGTVKLGSVGSSSNSAETADDTEASIAVSANVAEGYNDDGTSADTVEIRTGTTSVSTTATIYKTDATDLNKVKAVGAGVPVYGVLSSPTGTFQINAAGAGVTSDIEYTDANGQVTFNVTTTTSSSASNVVTLDVYPQSVGSAAAGGAKFVLDWDAAVYTLWDLNAGVTQPGSNASSYRSINASGSYTYGFALLDQWGTGAAADTWRLQLVNAGRTVSSDTHTLSNGKVNVVVADAAQGSGAVITSTVNVQKLASGTWSTQATESWDGTGFGTVIVNAIAVQTDAITLDADAGTTYGSTAADTTSIIAIVATTAADRRISKTIVPAYVSSATYDVRLNGVVTNSQTGLARAGSAVTISGDSSILFTNGSVDAFGSINVMADVNGKFSIQATTTKSQTDSVITLTTANGASKTQKVTFSPASARSGVSLAIVSAGAEPGQTAVFIGTLSDKFGNPVDTDQDATNAAGGTLDGSDAALTVTYTGPGLQATTSPVQTDANGTFTVRVLMGSKDSGSATVSATYGAANGSISAADTALNIDIKATTTVTVGVAAVDDVSDTKVNVGTFKGYVALYAKGYKGQKFSAIVAGKWIVVESLASDFERVVRFTGAGYTITTKIYIDGVMIGDAFTTVTK